MLTKKYYYHVDDENLYHKVLDNIKISKDKYIIFLNGNVGAGKTSFVKSYLSSTKAAASVTSPTFTIINEYKADSKIIYHYDFYRLKNKKELFEIGIDYYFDQPGIHFVEWSIEFLEYLPKPNLTINFIMLPKSRIIKAEIYDKK